MKISFSLFVDCVFSLFISFVLIFIMLNYFIDKPFSIIFSLTLASLVALFTFKRLLKKKMATDLKKEEKIALEDMITQFDFASASENNEFFAKVFCSLGYEAERRRGGIFFKNKDVAVFVKFSFKMVNKADVVKIFNELRKNDTGYILAESFSPEVKDFILRFNGRLKMVSADIIYKFLKEKQMLPPTKYRFIRNKPKGLKLLKNLLYKEKAKNYLVFGLAFLFMSYFLYYKVYYVVVGSVFLIASLLSRLFGISEKDPTN